MSLNGIRHGLDEARRVARRQRLDEPDGPAAWSTSDEWQEGDLAWATLAELVAIEDAYTAGQGDELDRLCAVCIERRRSGAPTQEQLEANRRGLTVGEWRRELERIEQPPLESPPGPSLLGKARAARTARETGAEVIAVSDDVQVLLGFTAEAEDASPAAGPEEAASEPESEPSGAEPYEPPVAAEPEPSEAEAPEAVRRELERRVAEAERERMRATLKKGSVPPLSPNVDSGKSYERSSERALRHARREPSEAVRIMEMEF